MISLLSSLGRKSLALPAVLIVWLLPTAVWAETITITNKTPGVVIVRPACQVRGQVRVARPFQLKPGDTSPGIVLPGTKYIEIRDAMVPTRILAQIGIDPSTEDGAYEIVMGTAPNGRPTWSINKVTLPAKCP